MEDQQASSVSAGCDNAGASAAHALADERPAYPFFTHEECPYFPCHTGLAAEEFNCGFCYCPLYALGPDCGGNYRISKKGTKDCTPCNLPHKGRDGIRMVREKFPLLRALVREQLERAGQLPKADEGGTSA